MTPSEFSALCTSMQIDLLYESGIFLGKVAHGNHARLLYLMDYFYVEIRYKKYRRQVLSIQCSDATDFVDPYLENISLEELINC